MAEKAATAPFLESWGLNILYSTKYSTSKVWRRLPMSKNMIYVGRNDSIQAAIDNATIGSTLHLDRGSYNEHLIIDKSLYIVGTHGATKTHLFGEVRIQNPRVSFQGLTFYPPVKSYSTITVNASSASIINCRFIDSMESLSLYFPRPTIAIDCKYCPHLSIVNNEFYGWKHGVLLENGDNAVIRTNLYRSCQVALEVSVADSVRVTNNQFLSNTVAVKVFSSANVETLKRNNFLHGNVVPFFIRGKAHLVESSLSTNLYSKQILGSRQLWITTPHNVAEKRTSVIHSSIGSVQLPLGVFAFTCSVLSFLFCLSLCMSVCLSACLSVCLSVYLSVWLPLCLPVCLAVCLSVCLVAFLPLCLHVWLSPWLPVCLPVCLSVFLSVCLPVFLSVCLSVCLSFCLPVCLCGCLPVWLSACLPVWLSLCLPVCLSVFLPVSLSLSLIFSFFLHLFMFACTICMYIIFFFCILSTYKI